MEEKGVDETILEEAQRIVEGARESSYGTPEDNFAQIAAYWSVYLGHQDMRIRLEAGDVAMMMVLLKIAREQSNHKRDNLTDGAGYLYCKDRIEEGK